MVLSNDLAPGFTVSDVGRILSRERTRQGLSLKDVGMRTGIPVDQLRGAETGAIDHPDGLATLKTVRRYADFLGLPGDRFALAILERWPTKRGIPHPFARATAPRVPDALGSTGTTSRPRRGTVGRDNRTEKTGETEQTGEIANGHTHAVDTGQPTQLVDRVGTTGPLAWHDSGPFDAAYSTAYFGTYSDTGITPAVKAPAGQVWRPPRHGVPVLLQALVVVVVLAVVAGVALLAVNHLKPSWLRDVGLSRSAGAPSAPPAHQSGASTGSNDAATASALRPATRGGGAVFRVRAATFTAELSSATGPCWVQVTTNTSKVPVYAGVIRAGGSRTFSSLRSLVVVVGSTSGRLSLRSSGGHLDTYAPPGAPYRITVQTHG